MPSLVLFLFSFFISTTQANIFIVPEFDLEGKNGQVIEADIPAIYHWTSISSLRRLAEGWTNPSFPFKKVINSEGMITMTFPQLNNVPGFFGWNNPIGGIGVSPQEIYASTHDPALIKFTMKKKLKILILESADGKAPAKKLNLRGIDVIFHSWQYRFHEFIIINRDAIEEFTADPRILKIDFQEAIRKFETNDWSDLESSARLSVSTDLFNFFGKLSSHFSKIVLPLIDKVLKSRAKIPELFKLNSRNKCSGRFA